MVGKNLVNKLLDNGYHNLLTPTSTELDLCDTLAVKTFFELNTPECVIHLAAKVGGILANINNNQEFYDKNIQMGYNIINTCKEYGIDNVIFMGSSCMYPRDCLQPMTVQYLFSGDLEPTNEGYARAKLEVAELCNNYGYKILIPPNIYGYYDHFDTENSHVISALITKMHNTKKDNKEFVSVWGDGTARREFLFVDDVCNAIIHFMDKDFKGYINIGSGVDISIKELAELIKNIVKYDGILKFDKSKPNGMPRKLMDSSIANNMLWDAKISLNDGLNKTYEWWSKKKC